jgi:hypothetical protein
MILRTVVTLTPKRFANLPPGLPFCAKGYRTLGVNFHSGTTAFSQTLAQQAFSAANNLRFRLTNMKQSGRK